jgi:hypothetical protein
MLYLSWYLVDSYRSKDVMVETFLNIEDLSYLYPLEMWAILFGVIILVWSQNVWKGNA